MPYIPLEKLIPQKNASIYKTVLTASSRANELAQGAQPLMASSSKKVSTIALEEVASNKVRYVETKSKGKKASA